MMENMIVVMAAAEGQIWVDNIFNSANNEGKIIKNILVSTKLKRDKDANEVLTDHEEIYQDYLRYYSGIGEEPILIGNLDFSNFEDLENLVIEYQLISKLNLTKCSKIRRITVVDNTNLSEIVFPSIAPDLRVINLRNNNLGERDLSCFKAFPKLKVLYLGTDYSEYIGSNIYNRWWGSLKHLENFKLEGLDINATDVSEGLEYISFEELKVITFGSIGRNYSLVEKIKCSIREYVEGELDRNENLESWATNFDLDKSKKKISLLKKWKNEMLNQVVIQEEDNSQEKSLSFVYMNFGDK